MTPTTPRRLVLLLDADNEIRVGVQKHLGDECECLEFSDPEQVNDWLKTAVSKPALVLLNLREGVQAERWGGWLATWSSLVALVPRARFLVAGGEGCRSCLLEAMDQGADGFLDTPYHVHEDQWRILLRHGLRCSGLDWELAERREREDSLQTHLEGMIGQSSKMQKVFSLMRKVAPSDVQVLILGESGTGKEVMAGALHRLSPRRDQPFVAINCAAIPEALLESELFGHEKGSFTGAHAQRIGRIEMAEGGTLFLDEIGELPMPLQVKLLRFLQERTFERIGGRVSLKANVRLISATNADLNKAMRENRFREDLYYRLAVISALLPPLRERTEDVILLARSFLKRVSEEEGKGKERLSFSVPALRAMERHSWPGNVRELLNRVKRAVIMAEGRNIKPADLDLADGVGGGFRTLKEAREMVERELALESIQRHGGNMSRVAEELGISRPALYELLDRYGMKP